MPQGKETVSDDMILSAFSDIEGGFAAPQEVAGYFDHTRQWADNRLRELYEQGRVERKKTGQRSVVYWPTQAKYRSFPEPSEDRAA